MPNRTNAVDDFMDALDHPRKEDLQGLRGLILASDERVTEAIKWKVPTFGFGGQDRITMNLRAKQGIELILHRGAKVKDTTEFAFPDPDGLLRWLAKDRAVLKIRDREELQTKAEAVGILLRRWMETTAD